MNKIALEQHGNDVLVTLPADSVRRLGLKAGQEVTVVDEPHGISLMPVLSERDRQMQLVDGVLREQAEVLRAR